eukprot:TRINITY_DN12432_c0_g1_i1.p1 TRINITY_DN12432_c0_g1~~TRINITY_DN12432_c0_g1_i1.p1  ORF type:complete len:446 (-),score=67.20 TRINITY_DN12432_c0_g1_i1:170-1507(-)
MERKISRRFTLGRQSSLAPDDARGQEDDEGLAAEDIEDTIQLLFYAHEGNKAGVEELLNNGVQVNSADLDDRTALHVAACEGHEDIVLFLIDKGADVNAQDRWGSTPLQDANHYHQIAVSDLLEKHGGRLPKTASSMRTEYPPEYEVDPDQLKYVKRIEGNYKEYNWTGTKVVVRFLSSIEITDENLKAFRNELSVLLKLRHPNVVQFLGAVTQSSPMMIVTEYLPIVLRNYLDKHKRLEPAKAIKYALDVARGMNYLHERKPDAIILHDLSPRSLMRDRAKNVKVVGFAASVLRPTESIKHIPFDAFTKSGSDYEFKEESCRYMAPELTMEREYDSSVDVFSFALILQEMIEGCMPFADKTPKDAAHAYTQNHARPPFRSSMRHYPGRLKGLIEDCWQTERELRPSFDSIINELEDIRRYHIREKKWLTKVRKYISDKTVSLSR